MSDGRCGSLMDCKMERFHIDIRLLGGRGGARNTTEAELFSEDKCIKEP
jgi:hypothetical protein